MIKYKKKPNIINNIIKKINKNIKLKYLDKLILELKEINNNNIFIKYKNNVITNENIYYKKKLINYIYYNNLIYINYNYIINIL